MPPKKKTSTSSKRKPEAEPDAVAGGGEAAASPSKAAAASPKKKAKKAKKAPLVPPDQTKIERQGPPPADATAFKAISWNVDGIRAAGRKERVLKLLEDESPDLLCIQETKLQAAATADWEDLHPMYEAHFSSSGPPAKKGYAGTAVYVRKSAASSSGGAGAGAAKPKKKKQGGIGAFFKPVAKQNKDSPAKAEEETPAAAVKDDDGLPALKVLGVTEGILDASAQAGSHDIWHDEGRALTVEYDHFYVVNLYVVNSGQKLERLDDRVDKWDNLLRAYVLELQKKKPVVVTGDLNVAHLDLDIWNHTAPHIKKQCGCTAVEKESFAKLLTPASADGGGLRDSFRHFHPDAAGWYTYWSGRSADARPANKGLRLDYFACSESMFAVDDAAETPTVRVHDSYMLPEKDFRGQSDHSPIGLALALAA